MKRKCPIVSYTKYCSNFLHLISCFTEASGLSINVQKSRLFSTNTCLSTKEEIKNIFGMNEMESDSKYLGLPIFWGRSKKSAVTYIKDKVIRKVQGWSRKTLPQSSKEILIKHVVQATPMYPMMCFKLPLSLCSNLNSIIGKFWWESNENWVKIHWGLWEKLTAPKGSGRMGFRNFESFNYALLAKQYWRMIEEPNAFG